MAKRSTWAQRAAQHQREMQRQAATAERAQREAHRAAERARRDYERSTALAAKATEAAFKGSDDVVVGGSAVAGAQIGSTVGKDLGRAELLAFPLLLILSLIFFRGRATLMPLVAAIAAS